MNKPRNPRRPSLRYFAEAPGQQHVTAGDRHVYARPAPRYRYNVIGTGTIGQEHMRVATLVGGARIHGVYDTAAHSLDVAERNHVAEGHDAPRRYPDLEAACSDPEADALIVCTPNHTHLEVLRVALAAGKPVLLEKPMATTLGDAAEILRLADAHPAVLQVGLQYRYKAIYAEARHELLERGSIGAPQTISIAEHRPPFLDKVGQWNKFARLSGGTLVEKCCHYFDLMNLFARSAPKRVFAMGSQAVNFIDFERDGERSDILDNASVLVEYENGRQANFQLNMFAPAFHEEMVVCGDAGRLRVAETFDFLQGDASRSTIEVQGHEPAARRCSDIAYPAVVERSGHHGATWFEHAAFLAQLDGEGSDAAGPAEGFWSIVVGVAAERSVATGEPVDIAALLGEAGVATLADKNPAYWRNA